MTIEQWLIRKIELKEQHQQILAEEIGELKRELSKVRGEGTNGFSAETERGKA